MINAFKSTEGMLKVRRVLKLHVSEVIFVGGVFWVRMRVEEVRPVLWAEGIFRSHWARREGFWGPEFRGKRGGR